MVDVSPLQAMLWMPSSASTATGLFTLSEIAINVVANQICTSAALKRIRTWLYLIQQRLGYLWLASDSSGELPLCFTLKPLNFDSKKHLALKKILNFSTRIVQYCDFVGTEPILAPMLSTVGSTPKPPPQVV